jgi:hypothetical protein
VAQETKHVAGEAINNHALSHALFGILRDPVLSESEASARYVRRRP